MCQSLFYIFTHEFEIRVGRRLKNSDRRGPIMFLLISQLSNLVRELLLYFYLQEEKLSPQVTCLSQLVDGGLR